MLLTDSDCPFLNRGNLPFYFYGNRRKTLRCISLFPRDKPDAPPIAAYVDQQQYDAALERLEAYGESCPPTFLSKVLFSSPKSECLHLYTAEIPSSLLNMLDTPAIPPVEQPEWKAKEPRHGRK
ncbi:hypothetical protein G6O67_003544 [Ophiocordyceps sinensis]|uniref:Uncharacterized protein n=1 Tax=Ophiocordyceps sinensis TaxID=72228 RepID=A0A8H4PRX4_9HYPO|nr:hypothetical protein G6O67_003544 [Ophiocordyceps sinensis]